ncbi:hypothetical protein CKO21_17785 [Rhodovibrio salinarum]|uniref:Lipoprotein n=1 Tax=Rhodovibrio salinarum TaxID=1087 RepID=A0A934QKY5_9PROT|nr:hypothetical protein [Rhodovibrio salinarum]
MDPRAWALRLVAAVLLVAALAGCRTSDIYNVQEASLSAPPSTEMMEVENAIKRAGGRLGWQIQRADPDQPGHLIGRLPIRSHVAVVDIMHNTQTFSITYKDSTNLKYDAAEGKIHSNYNGWVQNLRTEIVREASSIRPANGTDT